MATWLPLPSFSLVGVDCYGFICQAGYQLEEGNCVPAYVEDNVFWTVVALVLVLILSVGVAACFIRVGTGDSKVVPTESDSESEPSEPPDPNENLLPVAVELGEDGNQVLVFEAEDDSSDESVKSQ